MAKSAEAFRTISEVAEWLETPAHVLRFWESKFSQVKPVKRAGGRRYYRPTDMQLLGGIKKLLHEDGMTIKGVQKILREQGAKHVITFSQPLDEVTEAEASDLAHDVTEKGDTIDATVLSFQRDKEVPDEAEAEDITAEEPPAAEVEDAVPTEPQDQGAPVAAEAQPATDPSLAQPAEIEPEPDAVSDTAPEPSPSAPSEPEPTTEAATAPEVESAPTPEPLPETPSEPELTASAEPSAEGEAAQEPETPVMPSFFKHHESDATSENADAAPEAPQVKQVDVPEDPDDAGMGETGVLSLLAAQKSPLSHEIVDELKALAEHLKSPGV